MAYVETQTPPFGAMEVSKSIGSGFTEVIITTDMISVEDDALKVELELNLYNITNGIYIKFDMSMKDYLINNGFVGTVYFYHKNDYEFIDELDMVVPKVKRDLYGTFTVILDCADAINAAVEEGGEIPDINVKLGTADFETEGDANSNTGVIAIMAERFGDMFTAFAEKPIRPTVDLTRPQIIRL